MAATVNVAEMNGATPGSNTDAVSNINMGSTDAPNLVAATYPITAGTRGYEKWIRVKLDALGGSQYIKTIKVWKSAGSLSGSDVMKIYATESDWASKNYAQPVTTESTYATYALPTSEPTGANVGIDASLTATLGLDEYSDFVVMQLYVDAGTTTGNTITMSFKYEEVA